MNRQSSSSMRWCFFAIFAISGFSGLIYESVWSHYLKLFLGHAAYAQSLVLMIFMGGLALGSWLAARYSERFRAPILAYAIVEALIGLIALVFHPTFVSLSDTFYVHVLPSVGSPSLGALLKWSAAAMLMVPQSILLGMTFPLMSGGIVRRYPDRPGGTLALLYFTNSLGAAIGVLASGFWLLGLVGLPGTVMIAGGLNVALAIVVFALVRADSRPAPTRSDDSAPAAPAGDHTGLSTFLMVAAAVTGAASFIYEMGWIRMLSLVLGGTTHSFELMLSAFITGLAFGGLAIKRRIDRLQDPMRFAGVVQVLMGVAAILTLPLYVESFDWMAALLSALRQSETGYALFTAVSHGIALVIMVPTTFLAGMTLPLFTHILMRGRAGEKAIGRIYAANTVGAIAGVLFAIHIGFPFLGLESLIGFGAAVDVLLGIAFLHRASRGRLVRPLHAALAGSAVLAVTLALVELDPHRLSSGVYRYGAALLDNETDVVYYRDGKTASVSLIDAGTRRAITTNGKSDAAIEMDPGKSPAPDEVTMIMAGALPLAYRPDARIVANIGLGSGLTTHTLLGFETIEQVDTIEIEAAMVEAARQFGRRVERAYTDPRSKIHIEDAKSFFSLHNRKYDVIVTEPSNPWVSGVATLFSEEFYRNVRRYLAVDGIFVQWLQLYEFNDALALSVLGALGRHFADYHIYNTDDLNILIVATPEGTLGAPAFERLLHGTIGSELRSVGLVGAEDFLLRKTGEKAIMDSLLASASIPTNSDYYPYLDLNAGKARFLGQTATLFQRWAVSELPFLEMLEVAPAPAPNTRPSSSYLRSRLVEQARKIYGRFVGTGGEPAQLGPSLVALELLRDACSRRGYESEWLLGLHALAQTTLPFLTSHEGVELLEAVLPPGCTDSMPETVRAWHNLYLNVARRDPAGMAHAARAALEIDASASGSRRQYALAAAMLGHLIAGHPKKSIELWESARGIGMTPEITLALALAADATEG